MPPNKRLVDPSELVQLRKDLEDAHTAALACDTSGNMMRYGSSTWLTALQSESSSDKENKEESDHDCSDSSDECESQCMQVSTTAKFSSPEELYNTTIFVTEESGKEIEKETRGQSSCQKWFEERRKRVTATMCKSIVCRQKGDFTAVIRNKLYEKFHGNAATRYGIENEPLAIKCYLEKCRKISPDYVVRSSGLVIGTKWPWLAASPDALAHDPTAGDGLVEVKCPYLCQKQSISDALKRLTFLEKCTDGFRLKRSYSYYYQVQFQLLVSGLHLLSGHQQRC